MRGAVCGGRAPGLRNGFAGELGGVPDAGCPSMARAFTWGTYAYEGGGSIEILEPLAERRRLHRDGVERRRERLAGGDQVPDGGRAPLAEAW